MLRSTLAWSGLVAWKQLDVGRTDLLLSLNLCTCRFGVLTEYERESGAEGVQQKRSRVTRDLALVRLFTSSYPGLGNDMFTENLKKRFLCRLRDPASGCGGEFTQPT